jgi:hypothetical protein
MANVTKPIFKKRYGNFIGGNPFASVKGQYFDNVFPVEEKVCQISIVLPSIISVFM